LALVVIIFGEALPKAIAVRHPAATAQFIATPFWVAATLLQPLILLIDYAARRVFAGANSDELAPMVTEEELMTIVNVGEEEGIIEPNEREMIRDIITFGDTVVREIMIPRVDVVTINAAATLQDALSIITTFGHSRIPVIWESSDRIVGVLYAKDLLASAYDQLGYQAESGVWRSVYLTGAQELRHGPGGAVLDVRSGAAILERVPLELFFTAMATRLDGPRAAGTTPFSINFVFTDVNETHVLQLENAVLHHQVQAADPAAAATVRLTRPLFLRMITGDAGLKELVFSDDIEVEGSRIALLGLLHLLDAADGNFAIVTP
jgi:hypothetical protein